MVGNVGFFGKVAVGALNVLFFSTADSSYWFNSTARSCKTISLSFLLSNSTHLWKNETEKGQKQHHETVWHLCISTHSYKFQNVVLKGCSWLCRLSFKNARNIFFFPPHSELRVMNFKIIQASYIVFFFAVYLISTQSYRASQIILASESRFVAHKERFLMWRPPAGYKVFWHLGGWLCLWKVEIYNLIIPILWRALIRLGAITTWIPVA